MILLDISNYIEEQGRIEEVKLLKQFHLTSEGLEPMMAVLLKRGKIHKTINQRGNRLSPEVFYSWTETAQIPTLTVI